MDWIKKNPAQLALAVIALGIIAGSYFLWTNISAFPDNFSAGRVSANPVKGIPPLEIKDIAESSTSLTKPLAWNPDRAAVGSLFVGDRYVLKDGVLKRPEGDTFNPPVPNAWLSKYELDPLNSNILNEDPDKDGFNNLLEYLGMDGKLGTEDSTDPMKADSHPPYHTRLTLAPAQAGQPLKGIVSIPFRFKFMSWENNPTPQKPKNITVAINTIDKGNRTRFVDIGDDIPDTNFKAASFAKKEVAGADGVTKDVSELTIQNKVTGEKILLVSGTVGDSPDSYVVLRYLWTAPGGQPTADFGRKKGQTFKLPPDDKEYKVVDIKTPPKENPTAPGEVHILLPSGQPLVLKTNDPDLVK
jgi:hypothetical protein